MTVGAVMSVFLAGLWALLEGRAGAFLLVTRAPQGPLPLETGLGQWPGPFCSLPSDPQPLASLGMACAWGPGPPVGPCHESGTCWAGSGSGFPLFSSLPCQVAWPELAGAALPTRWWLPTRCPTSSTSTSSWGARSSSPVPRSCLQVRRTRRRHGGDCTSLQACVLAACGVCFWSPWSCGSLLGRGAICSCYRGAAGEGRVGKR